MGLSRFLSNLRLSWGTDYRLEGKRYVAGYDEERTVALLRYLHAHSLQATRLDWLLPLRPVIREIESLNTRAFLAYTISTNSDLRVLRLAIWLRGRCGGYIGSAIVAKHMADPNNAIRKEVARCLRRLSAWPALRTMANNDPLPRIRAIAQQPPTAKHERRQSKFLKNVETLKTSPVATQLKLAPDVEFTQGRPARQPWFIQRVLQRIQAIVTGA
jgi:hypothetical protein